MNNGNGAALIARARPGMLVTVRKADGSQLTGRASRDHVAGDLYLVGVTGFRYSVNAGNIVRVAP